MGIEAERESRKAKKSLRAETVEAKREFRRNKKLERAMAGLSMEGSAPAIPSGRTAEERKNRNGNRSERRRASKLAKKMVEESAVKESDVEGMEGVDVNW